MEIKDPRKRYHNTPPPGKPQYEKEKRKKLTPCDIMYFPQRSVNSNPQHDLLLRNPPAGPEMPRCFLVEFFGKLKIFDFELREGYPERLQIS